MDGFKTPAELQAIADSGYIITQGEDPNELASYVRTMLCEGYSLYGNPYAVFTPKNEQQKSFYMHCQAMIRGI